METHVKVLGVLHIALGVLGLVAALMIALFFGIAFTVTGAAADPRDAAIALPIIGLTGAALVLVLVLLSIPGIVVGAGLLKLRPWARVLGIILSVLLLIHIPVGTAVGVYGLWVLLTNATEQLFARPTG